MKKLLNSFSSGLACQLIASDAGYGPRIYCSEEREGITVMEYLSPENLPVNGQKLEALADLLKKIHGPSVPSGIDRSS